MYSYTIQCRDGAPCLTEWTEDSYTDIDLELVFLNCWAFGEVKKIRGPNSTQQGDTSTLTNVIPGNVHSTKVIPDNVTKKRARPSKTPQKKVTQRTSTRKWPTIDYAKLGDVDDIPLPKRKRHKVNLLHGPSKTVLEAHKKRKMMSPLGASHNKPNPATTSEVPPADGAGTSTGALIGTVMVSASADETNDSIVALLALGSDLPQPDEDVTADNARLAQINPKIANAASTSKKDSIPTCDAPKPTPPVPVHKRFVTVEYKLKRKRCHTRKFRCAKCDKSFDSQYGVNTDFKQTHPPIKCDYCDRFFGCPASMLKHWYSHYEIMVECKTCGKGFQFQSQLTEHRQVHQLVGDWVCFRPGCGKRFKRESELDAHLFNHRTTKIKCDNCTYENVDPRNVRAHKRKHDNKKSFICKRCGQTFTWVEQCK